MRSGPRDSGRTRRSQAPARTGEVANLPTPKKQKSGRLDLEPVIRSLFVIWIFGVWDFQRYA